MGERLLCKQEVIGSIPFTSTTLATRLRAGDRRCARSEKQETPCRATGTGCWLKGEEGVVM